MKLGVTAAGEADMEQAPMKAIIHVQAKCRGEKLTAQRSSGKEEKGKFKVRRLI